MLSRGDFGEYDGGCMTGGIPAYAGMTGGGAGHDGDGAGYDGMGGREWGTQRRKDVMKSRRGDSRLRGNDVTRVGMAGWGVGMTWVCCGNDGGIGGMT